MKKVLVVIQLLAFSLPIFAQQMFNSCVENETADCPVTLPTSFNTANSKLPDPFKKIDGTRISSKEDWACRRQEILKLAERTVYGTKPPKPASVTGTVSNSSITVSTGGASFSVSVSLPSSGTAPYPAVIRYDNSGADATVLRNNGVAVINYTTANVGGGTRTAKTGAFYTANPSYSKTGHLAAWAWGVSRIIDVIEQSDGKILKADAIGVTGCSRDGKGAFVAGVLDQRVALTMPMESGTGGTNIMRGAYADRDPGGGTDGAQSPQSAYGEQPWLGDDFNAFTNSPNNLPIDMHEAIALVAPRGFLVLEKTASSAGKWLNIPSSHAAALAAAEVYKALGVGGNMHYINTPTSSHCQWTSNIYDTPIKDFVDKFLHRKKAPGTEPLFTATAAPNMTNWIDWTTPTLSGELTIGGCGPAPSGFTLTTAVSPTAGGKVNTAPPLTGRFEEGQKVTLTAVAADGWKFDSWEGDVSGTDSSTEITMDKNKSVTAKFSPTADGTNNLIKNGSFANTQNWTLNKWNSSDATFAVSGGAANITNITRPTGTNPADHSLQLVQNGIALTQGMTYRLTFDASAAAARNISVYIQKDTDPYTEYMNETVGLTAAAESFSYDFEMTEPSDDNGRIAFNFGGATPNVSIRNVKLVYIAKATGGGGTGVRNKNPNLTAAQKQSNLRVSVLSSKAVSVAFTASNSGEATLKLYNLKGNVISAAKLKTTAGTNYSHTFNTGKIPNGFYLIGLHNNGKVEQTKVVVPR